VYSSRSGSARGHQGPRWAGSLGDADVSEQVPLAYSVQAFRRQAEGQFNRHRVPVLVSEVDAASIVSKRVDFNVVVNGDPQTQGTHK